MENQPQTEKEKTIVKLKSTITFFILNAHT